MLKGKDIQQARMALTQITDDWKREIDDKMIVGAVLIEFNATFDIINESLLTEKNIFFMTLHPLLYCG
jgi:hypothetical protein